MARQGSDPHGEAEDGDGGDTTGHGADPVAAKGEALAHAGGPASGEPAAGGPAYASGGVKGRGEAKPSGSRTAGSDAAPSNAEAPPARTAMDDDARASGEQAREAP